ncbi:thioredoxin family protein [Alteribacter populi]|uniref:thioredoxin family protein n=1 Tax=Alteribacter populi TaxID=2011011 RepID=UPI000BBB090B|nr:thioredoxin family protein [Alteribacter populi]
MKSIQSVEQFDKVKNEDGTVFMFTAGWCPDCVVIEPELPAIEEKYSSLQFYKVNRDQFIEICQEHDIFGIPSFLFFRNGTEVHRFVTKDRKTKEQIEQFLDEGLAN